MSHVFITGTGTDIGKTLVMTTLCWQLRQLGKKPTALKPVASGFNPDDVNSDPALILKSCGLTPTATLMRTITPWQFRTPIAPNMAAAREGKTLSFEDVVKFCKDHMGLQSDLLLVEGAGGVMSPLTDKHTMLDWMVALGWPVVLVTGSYLGAVTHALTAVETLRARNLPIRALIISASEKSPVTPDETAEAMKNFMPGDVSVLRLPRVTQTQEPWKHLPPISWIAE